MGADFKVYFMCRCSVTGAKEYSEMRKPQLYKLLIAHTVVCDKVRSMDERMDVLMTVPLSHTNRYGDWIWQTSNSPLIHASACNLPRHHFWCVWGVAKYSFAATLGSALTMSILYWIAVQAYKLGTWKYWCSVNGWLFYPKLIGSNESCLSWLLNTFHNWTNNSWQ